MNTLKVQKMLDEDIRMNYQTKVEFAKKVGMSKQRFNDFFKRLGSKKSHINKFFTILEKAGYEISIKKKPKKKLDSK